MTTAQNIAASADLDVTCQVDALLEATAKLLSVVPAKSPKPVLSNIRFVGKGKDLELSGSDATVGIHYMVPNAQVAAEGESLLNGARFSEMIKEFRGLEAKLTFSTRGGCKFKAKGGRYKVVGDDIRDFPKLPRFDEAKGFELPGSDVVDMIKKTAFAAAPEESRLTINGVLLELKAGRFRLVATDNKRMAITERRVDGGDDFRVAVPQSFLKAVLKVTTKDVADKSATLGVEGTKIFYRLPGVTVYSTILQGVYPPYEEALSLRLSRHIDCSVSELLSTLRRAMLVNPSLTAFTFETGALKLQGASAAVGAGTSTMAADFELQEDEDPIHVGFNPSYFKDALEAMTAKTCRFFFQGPRNAGVLKELVTAIGGEGTTESVSDDFVYAVMPALLPKEAQPRPSRA